MSTDTVMRSGVLEPPAARLLCDGPYGRYKAVLEWCVALLAVVVAAPLVLLLLAAVRLTSRGVPLYRQKRLGAGGRVFTIYKIRTMYHDSESHGQAVWSGPGDPRVTPLGRLLRATHLDELPQLWNVLRGEMSLIGPRPERPEIAASLELALPRFAERLQVRPGLSGLAQVLQGPDESLLTVRSKLEYDLYYLEHFGPGLDARILLATLLHLVRLPGTAISMLFGFPLVELSGSIAFDDCDSVRSVPLSFTECAR